MSDKLVELVVTDGVGVLTINNPPANALTPAVRAEFKPIIEELKTNKAIRALVVASALPKSFVAGADIKDFPQQMEEGPRLNAETFKEYFQVLEDVPYPVIAAINGFALGGGTELALACDIRIADEKAKLGLPEAGLGLIPGLGGTQRLPRVIGVAKAKELLFTGKMITAEEALGIGLVNQVVPEGTVLEEATKMAKRFAKGAGVAIAYDKALVNKGMELPLKEALKLEMDYVEKVFKTADIREGVDAFLNKRKPEFKNK
ncbi:MAG: enoyl-CoA hydratase [Peptococcaceae bacterium]|jgi:enoyl-CoA hydratase/carnithine racemase|nr:enoyl-CoA hydratase [Peptococcaceae bacterium]